MQFCIWEVMKRIVKAIIKKGLNESIIPKAQGHKLQTRLQEVKYLKEVFQPLHIPYLNIKVFMN